MWLLGFFTPFVGLLCPFPEGPPPFQNVKHVTVSTPRLLQATTNDLGLRTVLDFSFYDQEFLSRFSFSNGKKQPVVPPYHLYSKNHFQRYAQSSFSRIMTYPDFCLYEDVLASLLHLYIQDPGRNYLFLVNDIFLYSDALPSYLTQEEFRHVRWVPPFSQPTADCILFDFDLDDFHSN